MFMFKITFLSFLLILLTGCMPKEPVNNTPNTVFNPAYQPDKNTVMIDGVQTKRYQPALTTQWNSPEHFNVDYDPFSQAKQEQTVSTKGKQPSVATTQKAVQVQHNLNFKKQDSKTLEVKFLGDDK